jgi:demethylmenaquinone methyltransferase/2-methoxy-6-polyprenyl-1,4-benzoquinol methylase
MYQNLQQTKGLVQNVFDKVFNKYDLMNDLISLGIHRYWKKELIYMMNPSINQKLIDVGCGTGDIGMLYSKATNNLTKILSVDPNRKMIAQGKKKLNKFSNIKWKNNSAEKLDVKDNSFDFYTISFGLRNTKDLNKSISEAYRVLKYGGRFLCLEFSKIENNNLDFVYKNYSKIIPIIGKYIVGDEKPYEYLIKSIDEFVHQEELIKIMKKNKFDHCNYRNLSGGIVAIHSGWKI